MIQDMLREQGLTIGQLDAVAISKGPGSYTGLRIGTSVAKGICYALGKPLVAVPTLQSIAAGMKALHGAPAVFCPMIDARRMEVYMAIYDNDLNEIHEVVPQILDDNSPSLFAKYDSICFAGDGSQKAKAVLPLANAAWLDVQASARWMCGLAHERFVDEKIENTAYFTPFYLKEFQATTPRKKV